MKEIFNGIPEDVNYRVIRNSSLSNLQDLNLQNAEWIHFTKIPTKAQLHSILSELAPNAHTLRFTLATFLKKDIRQILEERTPTPKIIYGRYSLNDTKYIKFEKYYLNLRQTLLSQQYTNARELIYELAQAGSIGGGVTWEYLCLNDKSQRTTGPTAIELLKSYGIKSRGIKDYVIGTLKVIAPELVIDQEEIRVVLGKSNKVRKVWESGIQQRQNNERLQAWREQLGLQRNIFEFAQQEDVSRSLKMGLLLKRYGHYLSERDQKNFANVM